MATATITLATLIVPYTPATAKSKGDVIVVNARIGIVVRDIAANAMGELCVEGTALFPKLTSGSSAIADGKDVYWKVSGPNISTTASDGLYLGVTNGASVDADATQTVSFSQTGSGSSLGGGGVAQATVVAAVAGTLTGSVDGTIADIAASAAATAGAATPSAAQVDAGIATAVATIVTGTNLQLKELQTTLNALIAALKTAGLMASA